MLVTPSQVGRLWSFTLTESARAAAQQSVVLLKLGLFLISVIENGYLMLKIH